MRDRVVRADVLVHPEGTSGLRAGTRHPGLHALVALDTRRLRAHGAPSPTGTPADVPAKDRLLTPLFGVVLAALVALVGFWLPLFLLLR